MARTTKTSLISPLIAGLFLLSGCENQEQSSGKTYPEMDSPGAQLLLARCGGCHAAPMPSSHEATIWPSVLQRMQMRMTSKGQRALQPEEAGILLEYLQRHAGEAEK